MEDRFYWAITDEEGWQPVLVVKNRVFTIGDNRSYELGWFEFGPRIEQYKPDSVGQEASVTQRLERLEQFVDRLEFAASPYGVDAIVSGVAYDRKAAE